MNDVLIGAIECHGEGGARSARSRLEPAIGCDHVVGQDSTVAPAADSKPVGISDPDLDYVIDAGFQVFDLVVAPVGEDRARILPAAARAASIIDCQHRISIRGEELSLGAERMSILPVWTAVNSKQERHAGSFHVSDGIGQEAMHLRTVLALEADFFGRAKLQLREHRVILMADLAQPAAFYRIDFRVLCIAARKHHRMAVAARPG